MEQFEKLLNDIFKSDALLKIVFSKSKNKEIKRAQGRMINIKGTTGLQIETFYADGKARHQNVSSQKAAETVLSLLENYRQVNVFTTAGECELKISSSGTPHLNNRIKGPLKKAETTENDHKKRYLIDAKEAAPFLSKLGVCDEHGNVFDKKRSKFRQINRFVELLDDVYHKLPKDGTLCVCDLCCGKSYLTFAVYYYLTELKKRTVKMYGMDLKSDVIAFCRETARELSFDGMEFLCGDIHSFHPERQPDLVISLHACDIATDIVLYNAVRLKAGVILSTPCCHHEMMGQLQCDELSFVSKHSILRQKLCDSLTDALRCLRLEAEGYKVQAMELIDPEETPKNVMIRAVYANTPEEKRKQAYEEYLKTVAFLGVDPYYERISKERSTDHAFDLLVK
ncbi:MAG: SAM-dependent methyltransferase [Clostridia bacterium]|nr:SAM-dependent methyltransferase [Clostridia bacterium]